MARDAWADAYPEWVAYVGHQLRDAELDEVAHFFEYIADDTAEVYLG